MRYKKQRPHKEIGDKGQKLLESQTVTLIGVGGVGSKVAELLARTGIGLRIIDKGRVELEDLQKQALYSEDDITRFKAKQAKRALELINSKVKVKTFHEELIERNLFLLKSNLVIDCSDDPELSARIGTYTKKCKIPEIYCYVSGSKGLVQASNKGINFKKLEKTINLIKKDEGSLGATTQMASAIVMAKAIKILLGKKYSKNPIVFDVWTNSMREKK